MYFMKFDESFLVSGFAQKAVGTQHCLEAYLTSPREKSCDIHIEQFSGNMHCFVLSRVETVQQLLDVGT